MGNILISMGKMWFSWMVNLLYAVLFGLGAWWLVPPYGAAGYAAAMLGYLLANIPCVIFLYRRLPQVMTSLRWGWLAAALAVESLLVCVLASRQLSFAWAVASGAAAASRLSRREIRSALLHCLSCGPLNSH